MRETKLKSKVDDNLRHFDNFQTQRRSRDALRPNFIFSVYYSLKYPACGKISPNWIFFLAVRRGCNVNSHISSTEGIGGGQESFCIWKLHSQIKHNCLKKNVPEVNATSEVSLDGNKEEFKAQATANFDSELLTKVFRSVIF